MKVAELEGALLDYWVARAQEIDGPFARGNYCFIRSGGADVIYSPSGDWARGGPIIEHARIQIVPQDVNHLRWSAYVDEGLKLGAVPVEQYGETPLVAAMRAYVASRFGDNVPDGGI